MKNIKLSLLTGLFLIAACAKEEPKYNQFVANLEGMNNSSAVTFSNSSCTIKVGFDKASMKMSFNKYNSSGYCNSDLPFGRIFDCDADKAVCTTLPELSELTVSSSAQGSVKVAVKTYYRFMVTYSSTTYYYMPVVEKIVSRVDNGDILSVSAVKP